MEAITRRACQENESDLLRSFKMADMEDTVAIKLPVGDVPAKAAMQLKKMTGLSLTEIKQKSAEDDFLIVCDYTDDDGLKLMNRIRREMSKLGIKVRQFEDGEEESPELFDNIEQTHREINAEHGVE